MKQFRDTNYFITEDGQLYKFWPEKKYVFSRGTKIIPERWQKLKLHSNQQGYLIYNFSLPNKRGCIGISQIVAECYLGPCPIGYQVDHIDNNRKNNHYTNLQYLTKEDNLAKRFISL